MIYGACGARPLSSISTTVCHVDIDSKRDLTALIEAATRLAAVTQDQIDLADAPRSALPVPRLGEDPRDIDLEEKTRLLAGIEAAARVPLVRGGPVGVLCPRDCVPERYDADGERTRSYHHRVQPPR